MRERAREQERESTRKREGEKERGDLKSRGKADGTFREHTEHALVRLLKLQLIGLREQVPGRNKKKLINEAQNMA